MEDGGTPLILQDSDAIFQLPLGLPLSNTPNGRILYLTRHGESMYNLENRIGGNPSLTDRGHEYALQLGGYVNGKLRISQVWTSQLIRTLQTSAYIQDIETKRIQKPELNEILSGIFDHLTYEEFKAQNPKEYRQRELNKLTYQYPSGESYLDLCSRIEPIMQAMDTKENLLVVCHQAVIRCILARFQRKAAIEIPYIKVPSHSLIKLTWVDGKNLMEVIPFDVASVSTHHAQSDPAALMSIKTISADMKKVSLEEAQRTEAKTKTNGIVERER
ncbi:hypothetical protein TCAL_04798 [Tigriopus californicus]|uniref:Uncharacterized protein n=1 Tax=Tigriopus californicus TaxID=6832 RepID=A0A553PS86_TIGCA|nr:hypothetical protein TCAL_04798 [Tigriopus californicus]|eukprot:TCALIF_04798-PA protein Name:"Similar to Pfkfb3 6-phosphofructo-2-kinase/fructose-2,6-bisphosphatase 3 (Rattus norvegicus)" AED:0.07 eAED:0.07 QI:0/-1/0/1/-1/1/1/0/273